MHYDPSIESILRVLLIGRSVVTDIMLEVRDIGFELDSAMLQNMAES